MKIWVRTLVFLFLAMSSMVLPTMAAEESAMVVGRVSQIEGDLLRYVPAENDWVAVVQDAPFGTGDTLYSGTGGMAEMAVPNGSRIRVGNGTQLQFIDLEADLSETDVASGIARFYNKGSRTVIKATSPYGYVLADPGTAFDFYVGENSVEVVAVHGHVSFVHSATDARYDVAAGSASILADRNQVSSGDGTVDPEWDRWNQAREDFWSKNARVRGRSVEYLPPALQDESYTLEENGRWESVPYEGSPRWFWRPTTVTAGWSPFTVGRWTDWYGDQTWIPAEPFGYVTHHYGNWVYVSNNWYWAPPVARVQIGIPLLNIGFFWNPGRVSWVHSGANVGWVPLAPRETYYSRRHWGGPHVKVVNKANITRININVRNYAYNRHAIVVNQNNFYGVNSYRNVRVANINNTTIINNYRAAPVVNATVINNYQRNKQRYNFTNIPVKQKPHTSAIKRIRQNETIIKKDKGRRENAAVLQQQVKRAPAGRINRESRVAPPKITNRIVPAREVNRPESEVRFQQKEIKKPGAGATKTRPGQIGGPQKQPVRPEQVKPERVKPVQPEQVRPQRVQPAKPVLQQKPGKAVDPQRIAPRPAAQPVIPGQIGGPQKQPVRPEQVKPERVKPVQPEQVRPQRVQPAKPVLQQKPGKAVDPQRIAPRPATQPVIPGQIGGPQKQPVRPEQVKPERVKPVQPEQVRPQRVQPAKPALQQKPGKDGEPQRIAPRPATQPVIPGQIGGPQKQPVRPEQVKPERVKPVQPEQVRPQRVQPAKPALQQKPGKDGEPQRIAPRPATQPVIPGQIGGPQKQPVRPEQVKPERVKPVQPQQVRPQRVQPANPAPDKAPEKVKPAKPGKQEKSKQELEQQDTPR